MTRAIGMVFAWAFGMLALIFTLDYLLAFVKKDEYPRISAALTSARLFVTTVATGAFIAVAIIAGTGAAS